jgi:hypothetical protein
MEGADFGRAAVGDEAEDVGEDLDGPDQLGGVRAGEAVAGRALDSLDPAGEVMA